MLLYEPRIRKGEGGWVGWGGVGGGGGRGAKLPYIVPLCYEFEV